MTRGLGMVTSLCLLCLAEDPASAHRPQLSLDGGESIIGTDFSSHDRTPAAFGEVVWNQKNIGGSGFTWAPDVIGGWIDGRDTIRDPVRKYTSRDRIWLVG